MLNDKIFKNTMQVWQGSVIDTYIVEVQSHLYAYNESRFNYTKALVTITAL